MALAIKWKYGLRFLLLICLISFIEAKEETTVFVEQNSTYENINTQKTDVKKIIGAIENVRLVPPHIVLKARIDTGAKTTSIDARDITPFERNGEEWVRFVFVNGNKNL